MHLGYLKFKLCLFFMENLLQTYFVVEHINNIYWLLWGILRLYFKGKIWLSSKYHFLILDNSCITILCFVVEFVSVYFTLGYTIFYIYTHWYSDKHPSVQDVILVSCVLVPFFVIFFWLFVKCYNELMRTSLIARFRKRDM